MKRLLQLLIICTSLVVVAGSNTDSQPKSNEQRVRDYVAAYNERKLDVMMAMVSDDVQWLDIAGDKITVETQGKTKLRESLTSYWKSVPTSKSELEWIQSTGSRVAAKEKAIWQAKSGEKSQSSLSVYEFQNGLIARVHYFPVEK